MELNKYIVYISRVLLYRIKSSDVQKNIVVEVSNSKALRLESGGLSLHRGL